MKIMKGDSEQLLWLLMLEDVRTNQLMKNLAMVLTSLILAGWMAVTAIVAVQNFTPVSFKLLTVQSIEIPFGVMLAFSAGLGAIGVAIAPLLVGSLTAQNEDD